MALPLLFPSDAMVQSSMARDAPSSASYFPANKAPNGADCHIEELSGSLTRNAANVNTRPLQPGSSDLLVDYSLVSIAGNIRKYFGLMSQVTSRFINNLMLI